MPKDQREADPSESFSVSTEILIEQISLSSHAGSSARHKSTSPKPSDVDAGHQDEEPLLASEPRSVIAITSLLMIGTRLLSLSLKRLIRTALSSLTHLRTSLLLLLVVVIVPLSPPRLQLTNELPVLRIRRRERKRTSARQSSGGVTLLLIAAAAAVGVTTDHGSSMLLVGRREREREEFSRKAGERHSQKRKRSPFSPAVQRVSGWSPAEDTLTEVSNPSTWTLPS
ncbi:hypothetical protein MBM_04754 [Drepanopeziza brunnea f. sp. 'multigermtubi' MB_m1]|uniref:Uncharacterized protein n=1 Tax=Marssonina brunnea f. sp. multigermtubi (strain MB_m1) TaxID=1072389 RepID=K1WXD9_MARBU|nr:uncharacterized protein MBM_04754 [Drepanopeziza brunnea f. sp. 'multigermtubi' MB_m1]EKD17177.1 hypothetical protein MBM_04754 [Drepanopeziza brunnea f. sp. 'multigermtubi' MB_m1]